MGYGLPKDIAAKKARTSGASGEKNRNAPPKTSSPFKQLSAKPAVKSVSNRAPTKGK